MPISSDINADTRAIADILNAAPFGGTVTLDTMTDAIGRDIRDCRYVALSAMRVAERETGAVFASVRRIGYRRLTVDEFAEIGMTARARIRRTARSSARAMGAAMTRVNDMTDEQRRNVIREQSALGLLAHLAQDRSMPKIPDDVKQTQPIAITMRAAMAALGINTETTP